MQDSQAHTSLPCAVKGKSRHPRAVRPGWLARAAFIFGVYSEPFTSLPLTKRPESKTGLHRSAALGDATTLPFILVCEGYGDAKFFDKFLEFLKITNCSVGCPSRDVCKEYEGDTDLEKYLRGIHFMTRKQGADTLRGLLVVVDADEKPQEQFAQAVGALNNAGFPVPPKEFVLSEQGGLRVGVFLMPGEGRTGTLEHLLLEATLTKTPVLADCVEQFSDCTGLIPSCTENQQAKMKMSALVAATCKKNPWASPSHIWSDPGNPVPIESKAFDHISEFLRAFIA